MSGKHWRSWFTAIAAAAFGLGAYQYDNQLKDSKPQGSRIYIVLNDFELLVMGPGMGVLGFLVMENLHLKEEAHNRHLAEERRQRFQMLGRIAASIAHEIRNPLQNLRLINEELRNAQPEAIPRWRDRLEVNLRRLDQAVMLAYELSRPALADEELDQVQLPQLVANAIDDVRRQLGHAPALEVDHPSCVEVRGRTSSLRIAVENLIRNAFEASSAGPIRVRYQELPGSWVLEIANPGIAPLGLKTGTETFISSKPNGIGVGVSIARHLARTSRGELTYEDVDGSVVARLVLSKLQPVDKLKDGEAAPVTLS